jgi:outer membrane protein
MWTSEERKTSVRPIMRWHYLTFALFSFILADCPILFAQTAGVPTVIQSPHLLDLRAAAKIAIENAPILDTAQKTELISDREYKTNWAKLLPSLDFTAVHGLLNNIPIAAGGTLFETNPTAPWYSSLNLGLTENLYDNGVTLTNTSIADLKRDLAHVAYLKARDTLVLDVATQFYQYSLNTALFEIRKQQEATLQKQFQTLQSQYHQGFKTKSDFLRLKAQVQRAELERINAQNNIQIALIELQRLMGVGIPKERSNLTPSEISGFSPLVATRGQKNSELFPGTKPALAGTYDYRTQQLQNEVNEKTVTFAEREYWPRIQVTGMATYSNLNYVNSGLPFTATNQLSWNALLTLQYNFWDWGIRRRNVEIARYNRDILDNTVTQLVLDANSAINNLMIELFRVQKTYGLTRELLELEEESYQNLEGQYREGKVAYLDLITGLDTLLDAKVQFYTSYFDALKNFAKYKFYEGTLYEALIEK